tara:strand:+ start:48 stop:311 length:264 start_codon:yes stop_codon:yes gene_type:complete
MESEICKTPFSCKLTTDIIIIIPGNPMVYIDTNSTIDLGSVIAYFKLVKPDGVIDETACVLITGGSQLIVRMTYEQIDAIINPKVER